MDRFLPYALTAKLNLWRTNSNFKESKEPRNVGGIEESLLRVILTSPSPLTNVARGNIGVDDVDIPWTIPQHNSKALQMLICTNPRLFNKLLSKFFGNSDSVEKGKSVDKLYQGNSNGDSVLIPKVAIKHKTQNQGSKYIEHDLGMNLKDLIGNHEPTSLNVSIEEDSIKKMTNNENTVTLNDYKFDDRELGSHNTNDDRINYHSTKNTIYFKNRCNNIEVAPSTEQISADPIVGDHRKDVEGILKTVLDILEIVNTTDNDAISSILTLPINTDHRVNSHYKKSLSMLPKDQSSFPDEDLNKALKLLVDLVDNKGNTLPIDESKSQNTGTNYTNKLSDDQFGEKSEVDTYTTTNVEKVESEIDPYEKSKEDSTTLQSGETEAHHLNVSFKNACSEITDIFNMLPRSEIDAAEYNEEMVEYSTESFVTTSQTSCFPEIHLESNLSSSTTEGLTEKFVSTRHLEEVDDQGRTEGLDTCITSCEVPVCKARTLEGYSTTHEPSILFDISLREYNELLKLINRHIMTTDDTVAFSQTPLTQINEYEVVSLQGATSAKPIASLKRNYSQLNGVSRQNYSREIELTDCKYKNDLSEENTDHSQRGTSDVSLGRFVGSSTNQNNRTSMAAIKTADEKITSMQLKLNADSDNDCISIERSKKQRKNKHFETEKKNFTFSQKKHATNHYPLIKMKNNKYNSMIISDRTKFCNYFDEDINITTPNSNQISSARRGNILHKILGSLRFFKSAPTNKGTASPEEITTRHLDVPLINNKLLTMASYVNENLFLLTTVSSSIMNGNKELLEYYNPNKIHRGLEKITERARKFSNVIRGTNRSFSNSNDMGFKVDGDKMGDYSFLRYIPGRYRTLVEHHDCKLSCGKNQHINKYEINCKACSQIMRPEFEGARSVTRAKISDVNRLEKKDSRQREEKTERAALKAGVMEAGIKHIMTTSHTLARPKVDFAEDSVVSQSSNKKDFIGVTYKTSENINLHDGKHLSLPTEKYNDEFKIDSPLTQVLRTPFKTESTSTRAMAEKASPDDEYATKDYKLKGILYVEDGVSSPESSTMENTFTRSHGITASYFDYVMETGKSFTPSKTNNINVDNALALNKKVLDSTKEKFYLIEPKIFNLNIGTDDSARSSNTITSSYKTVIESILDPRITEEIKQRESILPETSNDHNKIQSDLSGSSGIAAKLIFSKIKENNNVNRENPNHAKTVNLNIPAKSLQESSLPLNYSISENKVYQKTIQSSLVPQNSSINALLEHITINELQKHSKNYRIDHFKNKPFQTSSHENFETRRGNTKLQEFESSKLAVAGVNQLNSTRNSNLKQYKNNEYVKDPPTPNSNANLNMKTYQGEASALNYSNPFPSNKALEEKNSITNSGCRSYLQRVHSPFITEYTSIKNRNLVTPEETLKKQLSSLSKNNSENKSFIPLIVAEKMLSNNGIYANSIFSTTQRTSSESWTFFKFDKDYDETEKQYYEDEEKEVEEPISREGLVNLPSDSIESSKLQKEEAVKLRNRDQVEVNKSKAAKSKAFVNQNIFDSTIERMGNNRSQEYTTEVKYVPTLSFKSAAAPQKINNEIDDSSLNTVSLACHPVGFKEKFTKHTPDKNSNSSTPVEWLIDFKIPNVSKNRLPTTPVFIIHNFIYPTSNPLESLQRARDELGNVAAGESNKYKIRHSTENPFGFAPQITTLNNVMTDTSIDQHANLTQSATMRTQSSFCSQTDFPLVDAFTNINKYSLQGEADTTEQITLNISSTVQFIEPVVRVTENINSELHESRSKSIEMVSYRDLNRSDKNSNDGSEEMSNSYAFPVIANTSKINEIIRVDNVTGFNYFVLSPLTTSNCFLSSTCHEEHTSICEFTTPKVLEDTDLTLQQLTSTMSKGTTMSYKGLVISDDTYNTKMERVNSNDFKTNIMTEKYFRDDTVVITIDPEISNPSSSINQSQINKPLLVYTSQPQTSYSDCINDVKTENYQAEQINAVNITDVAKGEQISSMIDTSDEILVDFTTMKSSNPRLVEIGNRVINESEIMLISSITPLCPSLNVTEYPLMEIKSFPKKMKGSEREYLRNVWRIQSSLDRTVDGLLQFVKGIDPASMAAQPIHSKKLNKKIQLINEGAFTNEINVDPDKKNLSIYNYVTQPPFQTMTAVTPRRKTPFSELADNINCNNQSEKELDLRTYLQNNNQQVNWEKFQKCLQQFNSRTKSPVILTEIPETNQFPSPTQRARFNIYNLTKPSDRFKVGSTGVDETYLPLNVNNTFDDISYSNLTKMKKPGNFKKHKTFNIYILNNVSLRTTTSRLSIFRKYGLGGGYNKKSDADTNINHNEENNNATDELGQLQPFKGTNLSIKKSIDKSFNKMSNHNRDRWPTPELNGIVSHSVSLVQLNKSRSENDMATVRPKNDIKANSRITSKEKYRHPSAIAKFNRNFLRKLHDNIQTGLNSTKEIKLPLSINGFLRNKTLRSEKLKSIIRPNMISQAKQTLKCKINKYSNKSHIVTTENPIIFIYKTSIPRNNKTTDNDSQDRSYPLIIEENQDTNIPSPFITDSMLYFTTMPAPSSESTSPEEESTTYALMSDTMMTQKLFSTKDVKFLESTNFTTHSSADGILAAINTSINDQQETQTNDDLRLYTRSRVSTKPTLTKILPFKSELAAADGYRSNNKLITSHQALDATPLLTVTENDSSYTNAVENYTNTSLLSSTALSDEFVNTIEMSSEYSINIDETERLKSNSSKTLLLDMQESTNNLRNQQSIETSENYSSLSTSEGSIKQAEIFNQTLTTTENKIQDNLSFFPMQNVTISSSMANDSNTYSNVTDGKVEPTVQEANSRGSNEEGVVFSSEYGMKFINYSMNNASLIRQRLYDKLHSDIKLITTERQRNDKMAKANDAGDYSNEAMIDTATYQPQSGIQENIKKMTASISNIPEEYTVFNITSLSKNQGYNENKLLPVALTTVSSETINIVQDIKIINETNGENKYSVHKLIAASEMGNARDAPITATMYTSNDDTTDLNNLTNLGITDITTENNSDSSLNNFNPTIELDYSNTEPLGTTNNSAVFDETFAEYFTGNDSSEIVKVDISTSEPFATTRNSNDLNTPTEYLVGGVINVTITNFIRDSQLFVTARNNDELTSSADCFLRHNSSDRINVGYSASEPSVKMKFHEELNNSTECLNQYDSSVGLSWSSVSLSSADINDFKTSITTKTYDDHNNSLEYLNHYDSSNSLICSSVTPSSNQVLFYDSSRKMHSSLAENILPMPFGKKPLPVLLQSQENVEKELNCNLNTTDSSVDSNNDSSFSINNIKETIDFTNVFGSPHQKAESTPLNNTKSFDLETATNRLMKVKYGNLQFSSMEDTIAHNTTKTLLGLTSSNTNDSSLDSSSSSSSFNEMTETYQAMEQRSGAETDSWQSTTPGGITNRQNEGNRTTSEEILPSSNNDERRDKFSDVKNFSLSFPDIKEDQISKDIWRVLAKAAYVGENNALSLSDNHESTDASKLLHFSASADDLHKDEGRCSALMNSPLKNSIQLIFTGESKNKMNDKKYKKVRKDFFKQRLRGRKMFGFIQNEFGNNRLGNLTNPDMNYYLSKLEIPSSVQLTPVFNKISNDLIYNVNNLKNVYVKRMNDTLPKDIVELTKKDPLLRYIFNLALKMRAKKIDSSSVNNSIVLVSPLNKFGTTKNKDQTHQRSINNCYTNYSDISCGTKHPNRELISVADKSEGNPIERKIRERSVYRRINNQFPPQVRVNSGTSIRNGEGNIANMEDYQPTCTNKKGGIFVSDKSTCSGMVSHLENKAYDYFKPVGSIPSAKRNELNMKRNVAVSGSDASKYVFAKESCRLEKPDSKYLYEFSRGTYKPIYSRIKRSPATNFAENSVTSFTECIKDGHCIVDAHDINCIREGIHTRRKHPFSQAIIEMKKKILRENTVSKHNEKPRIQEVINPWEGRSSRLNSSFEDQLKIAGILDAIESDNIDQSGVIKCQALTAGTSVKHNIRPIELHASGMQSADDKPNWMINSTNENINPSTVEGSLLTEWSKTKNKTVVYPYQTLIENPIRNKSIVNKPNTISYNISESFFDKSQNGTALLCNVNLRITSKNYTLSNSTDDTDPFTCFYSPSSFLNNQPNIFVHYSPSYLSETNFTHPSKDFSTILVKKIHKKLNQEYKYVIINLSNIFLVTIDLNGDVYSYSDVSQTFRINRKRKKRRKRSSNKHIDLDMFISSHGT